jgi:hypothetical protein
MMEMKKSLAVGVILLFIGVAVAPSINLSVVKASNDNDLVEVTTQACGINGYGNTTVKLTREHYQNLERYLVEFRARLNQTSTREEAVPIFKEAVVELDKYGLLPKGMSVEKAQRLVIGPYQNLALKGNYLCLITGNASNTAFIGLPLRPLINIYNLCYKYVFFFPSITPPIAFIIAYILAMFLTGVLQFANPAFPITFINYIIFGKTEQDHSHVQHYPSIGWIDTYGLFGKRQWNNSFYGNILPIVYGAFAVSEEFYIGAVGFTGLAINNGFFLGTAFHVDLI